MAVLATKHLLLSLLLVLGCAGGPDELHLGYGHTFTGDSTLGESHGGGWPISHDDFDTVTIGLSWQLRPQRVVVENPEVPPVRWRLEPVQEAEVQEPEPTPPTPEATAQPPAAPVQPPEVSEVSDDEESHLEQFDALGLASKIILGVLALTVLILYRKQVGAFIARWTPGTQASKERKAKK